MDGRTLVLALLAAAYLVQSAILFRGGGDAREWSELSPRARSGLAVFRRHACHSCHQLHGLGGFLGPDLTNVAARRTPEEIEQVLANGRRQMPRFELPATDLEALQAFLAEVDRTGSTTAAWRAPATADVAWPSGFAFAADHPELPGAGEVRSGEALIRASGCTACHHPFFPGTVGAPDLTLTRSRCAPADAARLIARGRGAMPGFPHLTLAQRERMVAYVWWMGEHRAELARAHAGPGPQFAWKDVPWFEIH